LTLENSWQKLTEIRIPLDSLCSENMPKVAAPPSAPHVRLKDIHPICLRSISGIGLLRSVFKHVSDFLHRSDQEAVVLAGEQKGAKGKGKAAKGGAEEGVELTPEEKLVKANLRIEALERELCVSQFPVTTWPGFTRASRQASPGASVCSFS
jgi:hypothetical protein